MHSLRSVRAPFVAHEIAKLSVKNIKLKICACKLRACLGCPLSMWCALCWKPSSHYTVETYIPRGERDLSAFFVTVHLYTNDDTVWEPWPVTAAQSATTRRRSIRFPFVQSLRVWSAFYKLKRPTRRYDLIKLLSFVDFQTQTNCTSLSTHNRHTNCSAHFNRGCEEMSWNLLATSRTMWRHVRKNNDRSITTGSVSQFWNDGSIAIRNENISVTKIPNGQND